MAPAHEGGNGPSLEQRHDEATRSQPKRAKSLGEDLIREDLRDEDRAGDLNNPMASPNPHDRHNASVESRRSDEARGGRCTPIQSRLFFAEASKAKQEKETI